MDPQWSGWAEVLDHAQFLTDLGKRCQCAVDVFIAVGSAQLYANSGGILGTTGYKPIT